MNPKRINNYPTFLTFTIAVLFGVGLIMVPVKAAEPQVEPLSPSAACSYVGDVGSVFNQDDDGTLVLTTTAAVAAGDDIIVAFATYGDPNYVIDSVTDSAGNTYENHIVRSTNYSHGRGYLFGAYNVNALPSGSTISIVHTDVTGPTTAVATAFTGLVDTNPVDQTAAMELATEDGGPSTEFAASTTPNVGPTGTTAQANELLVAAISIEGPETDSAGTWTEGFTAGQRIGGTDPGSGQERTVDFGYRIVSATGTYSAGKTGITEQFWNMTLATLKCEPGYNLTIVVDPAEGGTTVPAAGTHPFAQGSVVDVTATPSEGYKFDHWSGACTGDSTCQVTMDADKVVTASFVEAPTEVIYLPIILK